jgi:hypothetical protein
MERVRGFAAIQIGGRKIALAQWRHSQIDERLLDAGAAKVTHAGRFLHINFLKN